MGEGARKLVGVVAQDAAEEAEHLAPIGGRQLGQDLPKQAEAPRREPRAPRFRPRMPMSRKSDAIQPTRRSRAPRERGRGKHENTSSARSKYARGWLRARPSKPRILERLSPSKRAAPTLRPRSPLASLGGFYVGRLWVRGCPEHVLRAADGASRARWRSRRIARRLRCAAEDTCAASDRLGVSRAGRAAALVLAQPLPLPKCSHTARKSVVDFGGCGRAVDCPSVAGYGSTRMRSISPRSRHLLDQVPAAGGQIGLTYVPWGALLNFHAFTEHAAETRLHGEVFGLNLAKKF